MEQEIGENLQDLAEKKGENFYYAQLSRHNIIP